MSNCLFLGTEDDKPYLLYLKGMFNGLSTYVVTEPLDYLTLLEAYCTKRQITKVVSTNTAILSKLLERIGNIKTNPSLADYQGSLFTFGPADSIEIVFVSPLRHCSQYRTVGLLLSDLSRKLLIRQLGKKQPRLLGKS